MILDIISLALFISSCLSCHKEVEPTPVQPTTPVPFESQPVSAAVVPMIRETSGIADSKLNPGHLWAQEDSGNPTQLFLLAYDGSVKKKVYLKGITNRDWEDMTLSGNHIYIAETGDNNQVYGNYTIYQFPEPAASVDTVKNIKAINFRYSDKPHDSEGFLVDPKTKDIYLITKRDEAAGIYKITYPYSYTSNNTAALVGTLPYTGVVSAALSPDGKEIIVKTYSNLYHYTRNGNQPIEVALKQTPVTLPYVLEPQGEAVTFALKNNGIYTLSEKGMGTVVNLYFYKRK